MVAVDGARILGAPKECNEDKTGGGILHSISQLEKPSHLEAFITQADNLQGADNEFWQNIAGVLRRLQKAEKEGDLILQEVLDNLDTAKGSIKPNYVEQIKRGVPTALQKIKELRDEIKREGKQKERLGELLLRKLVERPTDAVQLRDNRPASREGGKRKPTSPPGGNSQRNKIGRTTKSPHLQVSPCTERSVSATAAYSQDGKKPRSPASSTYADSENSTWEPNRSDRRKRHQLLRRAQKNSANLRNFAAQQTTPAQHNQKRMKKKKKRKRKPRPPRDAVIIKPTSGKSFADILKNINKKRCPMMDQR